MTDKKFQIFVSSTYEDLQDERRAAFETILRLGHIPIGMELFSAGDDEQWTVITQAVDNADYYVVIIGLRYGSQVEIDDKLISYTEREYDYAVSKGIPVLAFIKDEKEPSTPEQRERDDMASQRLVDFRAKARMRMVQTWKNKDDLAAMLSSALINTIQKNPRIGWIPANFNHSEMANEITLLSKENRELRSKIKDIETRSPCIDYEIICDNGFVLSFASVFPMRRDEFSLDCIPDDLLRKLEKKEKKIIENEVVLDKLSTAFLGTELGSTTSLDTNDEPNDFLKRLQEDIAAYNAALPSQNLKPLNSIAKGCNAYSF